MAGTGHKLCLELLVLKRSRARARRRLLQADSSEAFSQAHYDEERIEAQISDVKRRIREFGEVISGRGGGLTFRPRRQLEGTINDDTAVMGHPEGSRPPPVSVSARMRGERRKPRSVEFGRRNDVLAGQPADGSRAEAERKPPLPAPPTEAARVQ